ncbi:transmembrane protein 59-like [Mizuhopecten yessoensis]|uniref:Transmembrane protein 59 n=1 Tax=Mizuhopecten yessoensis TaxID=6573 RepID=A0A210Q2G4_MIZYE|nr:transmembrane protein 59-like [Mizuhopecten yessoensis]OWF42924.1 Transmembrane protein 59 [Mizuhopecten yessoensis]
MAKWKELSFLVLGFFCINISSGGMLDGVLDDITSCVDVCSNTYSPHTYEKSYLMDSCRRGCRFFSIMELIYDHECSFNLTQKGCISSCEEAYNKTEECDACSLGCKSQIPQARRQQEMAQNEDPNIHVLYPLMYVHSLYSNMIDKVYSGMSISWSFYMQSDNGKVIVVRSEPQVYADLEGDELDDEYNTANYLETNMQPLDRSATPMLRSSQMHPLRSEPELDLRDPESQRSGDWLTCVSRKTGLPRLFLSLLLLSCAVMMIWLCLAATVTAPDHRVKAESQKLSINGDLEYLKELEAMGIKLSFPQDQEAGPLPIKLQVNRI